MIRCSRCSGELPAFAVFCPHCAQAHEPNFDDLINLTIDGRYHIYRRLGQGGLSTIFAATDLETDDVVVIKISDPAQLVRREMSYALAPNRARGYWDEMLERMRREAETLSAIDHPNIVRFHGTGMINDDLRYVVMEFLRGRTLREEMDRSGCFEPSKAVGIALEVASALIDIHSRGIVHRDINPRNIMIADSGNGLRTTAELQESSLHETSIAQSEIRNPKSEIKLIDFGIAKFPQPPGAPPFTVHATLAGTVAYASPEQCSSHQVDHRSDIYSLGAALYEMVTGQRPFNGRTTTEIALKQIQSAPRPPRSINPEISASLEKTILRALAKAPGERQQSVRELVGELDGSSNQIVMPLTATDDDQSDLTLIGNEIAPAYETGENDETIESNLKLIRRRRRRFVAAAAALLVIAVAAAILLGRPSASLGRKTPVAAENTVVGASPSPNVTPSIGSDPDSLELAANQQIPLLNRALANLAAGAKDMARLATPPTPSPATSPIPPNARPQMPPAPAPEIAIKRPSQPDSEPDLSQGPDQAGQAGQGGYGGGWRREDDLANVHTNQGPNQSPNRGQNGDKDRYSDSDDDRDSNRGRNNDDFNRRRSSEPMRRSEATRNGANRNDGSRDDRDDDDDSDRVEPKLIQWSGIVNVERKITIEMPGSPGTIQIPRAYRDRVGVIEPPNAGNRWRCATLRVFGRGGVSFVVRWWPAARNVVKLSVRR